MNLATSFFDSTAAGCCQDPVSSFTHLVGAVWFACLARPLLEKGEGSSGRRAALGIYAFSCVFLLSVSGIYHWFPPGAERELLRRLDVAGIFLLIAGTFTPICGTLYKGVTRWGSLGVIWTIALLGILLRTVCFDALPGRWGTGVFLGFGWLGGILAWELWRRQTFAFVKPLLYGGLAYTGGAAILEAGHHLVWPRGLSPHDFWHLAVLIGIAYHWQFISQVAELSRPALMPEKSSELAHAFTPAYDPAKM